MSVVYFGGDYTYWLSRYVVWLQLACIGWCMTKVILRSSSAVVGKLETFLFAVCACLFSTNTFPPMAWHTTDGIFFVACGMFLLVQTQKPAQKCAGYFLIALAYLCKQNFLVIAPAVLFLFHDWKKFRYWFAVMLPGLLYTAFLFFTGGLPSAVTQILTQTEFIDVGIKTYYTNRALYFGIASGFIAIALLTRQRKQSKQNAVLPGLLCIVLFCLPLFVYTVHLVYNIQTKFPTFFLFGTCVGCLIASKALGVQKAIDVRVVFVIVLLAWASSISKGMNYPCLVAGPLSVILMVYIAITCRALTANQHTRVPINRVVLILLLGLLLPCYSYARQQYVWFDSPAKYLQHPLRGVLPGAAGIKTNERAYAVLNDLQRAIEKTGGHYSIMPYFCGYWAKALPKNPIDIDMVATVELQIKTEQRLIGTLESRRGEVSVILPKVRVEYLHACFTWMDAETFERISRYNITVPHIFYTWNKVDETKYFMIYK